MEKKDNTISISIIPINFSGNLQAKIACIGIFDGKETYILESIEELFNFMNAKYNGGMRIISSDLRRDGEFILGYMMNNGFKPLIKKDRVYEKLKVPEWMKKTYKWGAKSELREREFKCFISSKGVWYNIIVNWKHRIYEFLDLKKKTGSELGDVSENFFGIRVDDFSPYEECTGVNEEVLARARSRAKMIYMLYSKFNNMGMVKDTIGRNCLSEYVQQFDRGWTSFGIIFPNLYTMNLDSWTASTVGDFVRKAYGGGFIYANEKIIGKKISGGYILDVSSLYTSRMHSSSKKLYPTGTPVYGIGEYKYRFGYVAFQAIRCEFDLKKGKLPFIRIHNTYLYPHGKNLETSDYECVGGKRRNKVELVLMYDELELMKEHYNFRYIEYIDYLEFKGRCGLFDEYIDKWNGIKEESEGVNRYIAKLYQNNLPGKFASQRKVSSRLPKLMEDGTLYFDDVLSDNPYPGYVAVGAACLSYSRIFHIKNCQKVHNMGKLMYSDTDCIFLSGDIPDFLPIADNKIGKYKIEGKFEWCYVQKAKRYIAKLEYGKTDIEDRAGNKFRFSAAGLSERGKKLFLASAGYPPYVKGRLTGMEKSFICEERKIEDFKEGISIPGQRFARRVEGGIIYEEGTFTIMEGGDLVGRLLL